MINKNGRIRMIVIVVAILAFMAFSGMLGSILRNAPAMDCGWNETELVCSVVDSRVGSPSLNGKIGLGVKNRKDSNFIQGMCNTKEILSSPCYVYPVDRSYRTQLSGWKREFSEEIGYGYIFMKGDVQQAGDKHQPIIDTFETYGICGVDGYNEDCYIINPLDVSSEDNLIAKEIIIKFKEGGYTEEEACINSGVCQQEQEILAQGISTSYSQSSASAVDELNGGENNDTSPASSELNLIDRIVFGIMDFIRGIWNGIF